MLQNIFLNHVRSFFYAFFNGICMKNLFFFLFFAFTFTSSSTHPQNLFKDETTRTLCLITSLCEGLQESHIDPSPELPVGFTDDDIYNLWIDLLDLQSQDEDIQAAFSLYQEKYPQNCGLVVKRLDQCWEKYRTKSELLLQGAQSPIEKKIAPYLLPSSSHLSPILTKICQNFRVLASLDHLALAGFKILSIQPISHVIIASHHLLPCYLLKIYLDNNPFQTFNLPDWQRLVNRCEGAKNVRDLIKKKKMKYFSVPNKWLYSPPVFSVPEGTVLQPVMLITEDMQLVSPSENLNAWKTLITKDHLDELYCILSHGYASAYVGPNIPYTKTGKFSCIDTEYVKREVNLKQVLNFLSPEMQIYWKLLCRTAGKKR